MATAVDLEQKIAELQNEVSLLQGELSDARKSLKYMNQLSAAIKAHKKATAAAKTALEKLQQQLGERDQEIANLNKGTAKLQEANGNLQNDLEEAELSTMHAIAAAEQARKTHASAVRLLEQQHELEAQRMAHKHEQTIDQWRLMLQDATAREIQKLVTIIVMRAIDKAKSDEATQLHARMASLQVEADCSTQDSVKKDQAVEQLQLCITERDAKIQELHDSLSNNDTAKLRLKSIIQDHEHKKQEVKADLDAARSKIEQLEKLHIEIVDSHRLELQAVEEEKALLHSK